jgi:hypothetical protein
LKFALWNVRRGLGCETTKHFMVPGIRCVFEPVKPPLAASFQIVRQFTAVVAVADALIVAAEY